MKKIYWNNEEEKIFKELKRALHKNFGNTVKNIFVFGSYARKENTSESDIDIVILLDTPVDWELKKEIHFLMVDIDLQFDVVLSTRVFSVAHWQSSRFRSTPFFQSVEREGVMI